jgi:hypothetical protein
LPPGALDTRPAQRPIRTPESVHAATTNAMIAAAVRRSSPSAAIGTPKASTGRRDAEQIERVQALSHPRSADT